MSEQRGAGGQGWREARAWLVMPRPCFLSHHFVRTLVRLVLAARLALAEGLLGLRDVDLWRRWGEKKRGEGESVRGGG